MRYPTNDDPELIAAIRRYVSTPKSPTRRYMELLDGNFTAQPDPERNAFLHALTRDSAQITDDELATLLESEWRSRITAAWLIAADRRATFRQRLGDLLLASELIYAGQGYCVALARLGTLEDAEILLSYLDRYLRRPEYAHDQPWAIGALMHIDRSTRTEHSTPLIKLGGLWHTWSQHDPAKYYERIAALCAELETTNGYEPTP